MRPANGREAVALARARQPDVLVMDIRMPVLDGIAATRELTATASATRVLVLTTYDLDRYVYDALQAGAAGFLLKASPPDRLAEAVRVVADGESLLAPSLTRRLIAAHITGPPPSEGVPAALAGLTDREREVLALVAAGRSNDEIAAQLVVSPATVKTHVNRVLAKCCLRSRAQAVVLAYSCLRERAGATGRRAGS